MSADVRVFAGVTFRRYPDAEGWAERRYFTPGIADRQRGVGRLHEEIWKAEHGPVPPGHDIHHADFDSLNNDPANLVCLPAGEHQALHRAHRIEHNLYDGPTPQALEAAAEWHRSETGREWHRQHAAEQGFGPGQEREQVCGYCGDPFTTRAATDAVRFCSGRCKTAWRRASGVDDEDRACERCGAGYRANRYSKRRYCSRRC